MIYHYIPYLVFIPSHEGDHSVWFSMSQCCSDMSHFDIGSKVTILSQSIVTFVRKIFILHWLFLKYSDFLPITLIFFSNSGPQTSPVQTHERVLKLHTGSNSRTETLTLCTVSPFNSMIYRSEQKHHQTFTVKKFKNIHRSCSTPSPLCCQDD